MISRVVDAALAELDLTTIVLENVDLDAIAAQLDVEAVINRVDLDGVVASVDLDAAVAPGRSGSDRLRIDIDGIVAGSTWTPPSAGSTSVRSSTGWTWMRIVGKVDVDAIINRVDIDGIVAGVDLDSIVRRLDLNKIADGLELDPLVAKVNLMAVVDRLDIGAVVAKVDPDPIVARVNFDAAMAQIDLIGIAQKIVDGIDLPGIIRDSTGSLASEAVHGVRVQGQHADDAVGQLVGRVFRRRAALDGTHPGKVDRSDAGHGSAGRPRRAASTCRDRHQVGRHGCGHGGGRRHRAFAVLPGRGRPAGLDADNLRMADSAVLGLARLRIGARRAVPDRLVGDDRP